MATFSMLILTISVRLIQLVLFLSVAEVVTGLRAISFAFVIIIHDLAVVVNH